MYLEDLHARNRSAAKRSGHSGHSADNSLARETRRFCALNRLYVFLIIGFFVS